MFFVVLVTPLLDQRPGLQEVAEEFAIQDLVPESGIEAFDVGVLPGRSRLNVLGLCPERFEFFPERPGNELRTVVRADEVRGAMDGYQTTDLAGNTPTR